MVFNGFVLLAWFLAANVWFRLRKPAFGRERESIRRLCVNLFLDSPYFPLSVE